MTHLPRLWPLFLAFLRLGLTAFGGPVAHLGYFRTEFVERRRWLTGSRYGELVALCQFLPGPASSQVGMAIGYDRAGYLGALVAWLAFTLPSALLMMLFALGVTHIEGLAASGVLHGLKVVAVAVVAQALLAMGRQHCVGTVRLALMLASCLLVLVLPGSSGQLLAIALGALFGWLWLDTIATPITDTPPLKLRQSLWWLGLFALLLLTLPIVAGHGLPLALADAFYRSGALVFGGGHVVLPLLEAQMQSHHWLGSNTFLAGYGAAQAVPGPLFTFAAFLGGAIDGWRGGLVALLAIFTPALLLVFAILPLWERLRLQSAIQKALGGINAAVVGLLLAALITPVWPTAIGSLGDMLLALVALLMLSRWYLAPWKVVAFGALWGGLAGFI